MTLHPKCGFHVRLAEALFTLQKEACLLGTNGLYLHTRPDTTNTVI